MSSKGLELVGSGLELIARDLRDSSSNLDVEALLGVKAGANGGSALSKE